MKITLDIPDDGWFKMNSNLELKEDEVYLVDANTARVPELCVYIPNYRFLRILTTMHMRDWGGDGDASMSYFELYEVDYIKPIKMEKYSALVIFEMVKEWMQDESEN